MNCNYRKANYDYEKKTFCAMKCGYEYMHTHSALFIGFCYSYIALLAIDLFNDFLKNSNFLHM